MVEYDLHGVRVCVHCAERLAAALDTFLGWCRVAAGDRPRAGGRPPAPARNGRVVFSISPSCAGSEAGFIPGGATPIGESEAVLPGPFRLKCRALLGEEPGLLYLDFCNQGAFRLDPGAGRADAWVDLDEAGGPLGFAKNLFCLSLFEMLKPRGLFMLHAAAVARSGEAVLFPGGSGVGKTTACLALVRAGLGFGFLSDDRVVLRWPGRGRRGASTEGVPTEARVEVLCFPDYVDVGPRTVRFFPELARVRKSSLSTARNVKTSFWIGDAYEGTLCGSGRAAALVFPEIGDGRDHSAEPLARKDALDRLLEAGLFCLNPAYASEQFRVLGELADRVPALRLRLGNDMTALPDFLLRVLDGITSPASVPRPGFPVGSERTHGAQAVHAGSGGESDRD